MSTDLEIGLATLDIPAPSPDRLIERAMAPLREPRRRLTVHNSVRRWAAPPAAVALVVLGLLVMGVREPAGPVPALNHAHVVEGPTNSATYVAWPLLSAGGRTCLERTQLWESAGARGCRHRSPCLRTRHRHAGRRQIGRLCGHRLGSGLTRKLPRSGRRLSQ